MANHCFSCRFNRSSIFLPILLFAPRRLTFPTIFLGMHSSHGTHMRQLLVFLRACRSATASLAEFPHFDDTLRRWKRPFHGRNRDVSPCRNGLRHPCVESEIGAITIVPTLKMRANFIRNRLRCVVVGVKTGSREAVINKNICHAFPGDFGQQILHREHGSAHLFNKHLRVINDHLSPVYDRAVSPN